MGLNAAATLLIALTVCPAFAQNNQTQSGSAETRTARDAEKVNDGATARLNVNSIDFIVSAIDDQTRAEFQKAWWIAGGGVKSIEAVVLLYRGRNGSLIARSQGCTNQRLSFSFAWSPTIIAVVHTHPNSASPEPQRNDLQIADRFGVPIFTITNRGMFVYDPGTRMTTKVAPGLVWLGPSRRSDNGSLAASRRDPNPSLERHDR
jgi:hypothetical protein